jgi:hypothetical protein
MVYTRAFLSARDAVKLQLKREGKIVCQYKPATLSEMAKELFESDRERLLAEAREQIAKRARRA